MNFKGWRFKEGMRVGLRVKGSDDLKVLEATKCRDKIFAFIYDGEAHRVFAGRNVTLRPMGVTVHVGKNTREARDAPRGGQASVTLALPEDVEFVRLDQ